MFSASAAPFVKRFHPSLLLNRLHYVVVKQKVSVLRVASCPSSLMRRGPCGPVLLCWCTGWQACRMLLYAPHCPNNLPPHSYSRGDDATLIDSNRKWQNQWETRKGCVCEILQELLVTDQELWHHSPVIPAAPGLRPVTARSIKEKYVVIITLLRAWKECFN